MLVLEKIPNSSMAKINKTTGRKKLAILEKMKEVTEGRGLCLVQARPDASQARAQPETGIRAPHLTLRTRASGGTEAKWLYPDPTPWGTPLCPVKESHICVHTNLLKRSLFL